MYWWILGVFVAVVAVVRFLGLRGKGFYQSILLTSARFYILERDASFFRCCFGFGRSSWYLKVSWLICGFCVSKLREVFSREPVRVGLGAEVGVDGFSLYWYAVGVQVSKWCTGGFSVFVWPLLQWSGFKDTLEAHSLNLLEILQFGKGRFLFLRCFGF